MSRFRKKLKLVIGGWGSEPTGFLNCVLLNISIVAILRFQQRSTLRSTAHFRAQHTADTRSLCFSRGSALCVEPFHMAICCRAGPILCIQKSIPRQRLSRFNKCELACWWPRVRCHKRDLRERVTGASAIGVMSIRMATCPQLVVAFGLYIVHRTTGNGFLIVGFDHSKD